MKVSSEYEVTQRRDEEGGEFQALFCQRSRAAENRGFRKERRGRERVEVGRLS